MECETSFFTGSNINMKSSESHQNILVPLQCPPVTAISNVGVGLCNTKLSSEKSLRASLHYGGEVHRS